MYTSINIPKYGNHFASTKIGNDCITHSNNYAPTQ